MDPVVNLPLENMGIEMDSPMLIWGPVLVQVGCEAQTWQDAYISHGGIYFTGADVDRVRIMLNPRAVQATPRRDVKCQFVDDEG